jgi:predicted PurR-regulated permease PerM
MAHRGGYHVARMEPRGELAPRTVGERMLAPETLWDRVLRYGAFCWAGVGILGFLFILYRYVLYPIRVVFPPVAIALVVTYLLNPLVSRLERRGMRRGLAVAIIFLAFVAVVGVALANLIPLVVRQVGGFFDKLPDYLTKATDEINKFASRRGSDFRIKANSEEIFDAVKNNREAVTSFLGGVRSFAAGVLHVFLNLVIGIVLSIYMLVDLPKMQRGISNAIPPRHREETLLVGDRVGRALGGFFRGQLLVALFVGVASAVGLTLVKLPFAVLVGLIAGIFNLVPLIGPFIGAIPAVFIGLLSGEPVRALYAVIVLLVVQQIDNHIISPNVMGRTVKLHPITVMLSLLAGGTIAGIFGMLIVIPGVAAVKIVAAHAWRRGDVREALVPAFAGAQMSTGPSTEAAAPAPAPEPAPAASLPGPVAVAVSESDGSALLVKRSAVARRRTGSRARASERKPAPKRRRPSRGSPRARSRTRSRRS